MKVEKAISVSELTNYIKRVIEENFEQVRIIGEISNFKAHASGHWYFTLKDKNAQISCTMWKGLNNYVFFTPQDGMQIVVTGKITVYPPRGNYQLDVKSMKPAGEGELQKAFEQLKRKLFDEGLFDDEHKRPIPKFPAKIGIVTGTDTAALKDMLSVAERRYPILELIIAPTRVQGEGAAEQIAASIENLNQHKDIDLIIIARGGGSLEDLWAFNEEIVARAIYKSKIPIISGVGHEIDFTIADFVADLRAPTPSAAMEIATPNKDEIIGFLEEISDNNKNYISEKIENLKYELNYLNKSYGFKNITNLINTKKQTIDNYIFRIQVIIANFLKSNKNNLSLFSKIILSNNVNSILKKGFVLIEQDEKIIKRKTELKIDRGLELKFYDGNVSLNK
ncbi:MAG: exodeoxyribonuclease VII large subunit [Ignavibacteriales bacterium]|nr:exodeoxyribonuclease VII large subunit [Ignavibacteriales bacterium]